MSPLYVRDVLAQLLAFDTGEEVAISVHTSPEKAQTFAAGPIITREPSSGRALLHVDTTREPLKRLRSVRGQ